MFKKHQFDWKKWLRYIGTFIFAVLLGLAIATDLLSDLFDREHHMITLERRSFES